MFGLLSPMLTNPTARIEADPRVSDKMIGKFARRVDRDVNGLDGLIDAHRLQTARRQCRQEAVREDLFDIARTAFRLAAACRDSFDQIVFPGEPRPVGVGDPTPDSLQLQGDDAMYDLVRQRKIGNHGNAPEKGRLEYF